MHETVKSLLRMGFAPHEFLRRPYPHGDEDLRDWYELYCREFAEKLGHPLETSTYARQLTATALEQLIPGDPRMIDGKRDLQEKLGLG